MEILLIGFRSTKPEPHRAELNQTEHNWTEVLVKWTFNELNRFEHDWTKRNWNKLNSTEMNGKDPNFTWNSLNPNKLKWT